MWKFNFANAYYIVKLQGRVIVELEIIKRNSLIASFLIKFTLIGHVSWKLFRIIKCTNCDIPCESFHFLHFCLRTYLLKLSYKDLNPAHILFSDNLPAKSFPFFKTTDRYTCNSDTRDKAISRLLL